MKRFLTPLAAVRMVRTGTASRFLNVCRDEAGAVALMFAVLGGMLVFGMTAMLNLVDVGWSRQRSMNSSDVANLGLNIAMSHYLPGTNGTYSASQLAQMQTDAMNYYKANAQSDSVDPTFTASNFVLTVSGTPATQQTISLTVKSTTSLFVSNAIASAFGWKSPATFNVSSSSGASLGNGTTLDMTVTNSSVRIPQSTLELVMVLDNTGSMAQAAASGSSTSKMTGLKYAANTLIDDLLTSTSTNTYIGLVPFASTVNVKNALSSSGSWLSQTFSYNSNGVNMANWGGCVAEPRTASPNKYLTPQAYTPSSTPKFTPYYFNVPSTGLVTRDYSRTGNWYSGYTSGALCSSSYSQSSVNGFSPAGSSLTFSNGYPNYCGYTGDGVGNGITYNWDTSSSYNLYTYTVSQNTDCMQQPVTFLTSNSSTLKTAVANMTANGSTVIPVGILWGWRMLSSTWSQAIAGTGNGWVNSDTSFPKPEVTPGLQRVMIVLTDGENDVGVKNLIPNDLYFNGLSGVGDGTLTAPSVVRSDGTTLANGRMDAIELHGNALQSGGVGWPDDINTFQLAACTNIKNAGITIYSITFGTVSDVAAATMQSCATSGNYYHAPDNTSLNTIFNQIAGNLGIVRLTK